MEEEEDLLPFSASGFGSCFCTVQVRRAQGRCVRMKLPAQKMQVGALLPLLVLATSTALQIRVAVEEELVKATVVLGTNEVGYQPRVSWPRTVLRGEQFVGNVVQFPTIQRDQVKAKMALQSSMCRWGSWVKALTFRQRVWCSSRRKPSVQQMKVPCLLVASNPHEVQILHQQFVHSLSATSLQRTRQLGQSTFPRALHVAETTIESSNVSVSRTSSPCEFHS